MKLLVVVWVIIAMQLIYSPTSLALDETDIATTINKYVGSQAAVTVKNINDTLMLKGLVGTQYDKEKAEQIARTYTTNVKNMITIKAPEAIRLEARIYTVDVYKAQVLGVDWGTLLLDSDKNVLGLDVGALTVGQGVKNSVLNLFDAASFGMSPLGAQLDFLARNGAAQVIAQPTIITTSGSIAEINVGGQIVTPNVQSAIGGGGDRDNITNWKDYGIMLHIEPTMLPGNLINTRVKVEVSNIQWSSLRNVVILGNGNSMPSIKQNQAETVSVIRNGEFLVIGGLLYNSDVKATTKIPLLGDIPLLGWLFKSEITQRQQQEVVIVIQPLVVTTGTALAHNDSPEIRAILATDTIKDINDNDLAR